MMNKSKEKPTKNNYFVIYFFIR